jgi:decaprenylphospho-beta-D-ribofuranose 2-oxidase
VSLLTGWGRTAPTNATVVAVRDDGDVMASIAAGPGRGVLARGLGRAYGDAAQNAGGTVLDMTTAPHRVLLDAARGLATVAGGTSLDAVLRALVPQGWFVPVTPGTRSVTAGGAVAADIHGKNHHADGSWGAHVMALTLATGGGDVVEVAPDRDAPAFWATVGGMGLTGVVLACTVRLLAIETSRMLVDTQRLPDLDATMAAMAEVDRRFHYSVAWVDLLASGRALGRSVLTCADHAPLAALDGARASALAFAPATRLGAPPLVPSGLLNALTVRAFNEAWFRRAPVHRRQALQTISAFFHPLDGVRHWNRLYGRRGFLQYQCVVPFDAEDALRAIVARLSAAGVASFLAVLKRFGPGTPAPLSFPFPGWTLALDVPAAPELGPLLDELDEVVVAAGGRVYLAKDSRVAPELVPAMYPRLDEWRAVRERLDPRGVMQSDLGRRLHLASAPLPS